MSKLPALVWLPLVFVAGGLVGYYGPSEELRARDERAKEEKEKAKPQQMGGFGSFAQLVKIPDAARRPRHRRDREGPDASPSGEASAATNAPSAPAEGKERPRRRQLSPEDLRARIDEAADLWRTRVEIARGNAVAKLGLDERGTEAFDAAVAAMNEKLRESMQIVADEVSSAQTLTPELGVRLMGDLSTSLAETYDALGATVSPDRRGDISNLQLVDFIDPSVAEPLISVQDKLDPGRGGFGR
jgi:hypothetical protein